MTTLPQWLSRMSLWVPAARDDHRFTARRYLSVGERLWRAVLDEVRELPGATSDKDEYGQGRRVVVPA
jgi:hypothetical protein